MQGKRHGYVTEHQDITPNTVDGSPKSVHDVN